MSKTVGLFADVSNLYYCINRKFNKRKLDYKKLLEKITEEAVLYRALAYGTFINDDTRRFVDALKYLGYEPKFANPKTHIRKDGQIEYWNVDCNIDIAMDIVRIIKKIDVVYLGSNMSELVPLINWIREQGVKTVIISCGISSRLKNTADDWIELDETYLEEKQNDNPEATE